MDSKTIRSSKYLTIRNLFVAGNFLLFILFLAVFAQNHFREWKDYQREFYQREIRRVNAELKKTSSELEKDPLMRRREALGRQPIEIRQVLVPNTDRADRCVTCHVGHDPDVNPSRQTPYDDQPFVAKGNKIHASHPVEKFGCTVCHGGRGRATTTKGAHGDTAHYPEELLAFRSNLLNSCSRCHPDETATRP